MIKKISLLIILFVMLSACGKKGDPEYNKQSKININQYLII